MGTIPRGAGQAAARRLTPEPERPLPADPVQWCREALDEHLWSKQREILRALVAHPKVAVKSCHEAGKSFVASRAGAWWIAGHPLGEARIVSTAPSGQQVSSILWAEIGKAHRRGNLPGHVTRGSVPRWLIGGDEVGQGRKPADYVDVEQARTSFQGLHARYLLGILDEAGGIPLWLWQAMDTLATNESSRLLAIGNPDDPTTHFQEICKPGSGWHVITISAMDTPNFTGEAVPEHLRESLISKRWVDETIRAYGEDSPYVVSKVFGEFPEVADDTIISPKLVREAHERDLSGKAIKDFGRLGMDVADTGEDETCIYLNRGGMIRLEAAWKGIDTDRGQVKARNVLEAHGESSMTIDFPGVGGAIYHPLRNAGFKVQPYNGGTPAVDDARFSNLNAEAWWVFREAMMKGLIDLDPADQVLAAQLQSRRWHFDPSERRIKIESKREMGQRGLKSPDRADAAILSWYEGYRVPNPAVVLKPRPGEEADDAYELLSMRS